MDRQGYCCCFRVTYSKSIFVLQLWTCWTRCWPLTLTRGSRWRRRWHTPTWNNTTTPQMRWVRHLVLYGSPGFKNIWEKKQHNFCYFTRWLKSRFPALIQEVQQKYWTVLAGAVFHMQFFYIYKYWVLHFQRLMVSSGLILNMRFKDNDVSEDRQRVTVWM